MWAARWLREESWCWDRRGRSGLGASGEVAGVRRLDLTYRGATACRWRRVGSAQVQSCSLQPVSLDLGEQTQPRRFRRRSEVKPCPRLEPPGARTAAAPRKSPRGARGTRETETRMGSPWSLRDLPSQPGWEVGQGMGRRWGSGVGGRGVGYGVEGWAGGG